MNTIAWSSAAALIAAAVVSATVPWRIPRALVDDAIEAGPVRAVGLHATLAGPATFKLLPRPRIQVTQVSFRDGKGAVMVDVPLLKAELDIPSLIRRTWRLTSATFVEPTATVDLDRLDARGLAELAAPLRLNVRGGVLRTRSTVRSLDGLATGIDASVIWPGDGDALVASGTGTVGGTVARFTGGLGSPSHGSTPEGSTATLQVESPLFGLSLDGLISGGTQQQFAGHAALTTTSLPKLLQKLDNAPLALAAKRAQFSGDILARPHDVSLSNATVKLDAARFEGTLAWRRDGDRNLVAGTLATDLFDVDALWGDGVDRQSLSDLYRRTLVASPFRTDVDMRVSAGTARIDRVTLEDAAISTLVRGDRLELTVDEARAYGGLVKSRLVATVGPDGIDAHADLSAKSLDLAQLCEALGGGERIGGTLTAQTTLEGRGTSLLDVVAKLEGTGQLSVEEGHLAGLSLARTLRPLGRRIALDVDRRQTPTVFDRAKWDLAIKDGVIRIPDGRLTAPGLALSFGAETRLPDGQIAVHAVADQTDRVGSPLRGGQSLPLDMRGTWGGPLVLVAHGIGGFPALSLPLADGIAPQP